MKNLKADSEDSLRPEYQRSDFREVVQGKYATTQVDFHQFAGALLVCIGEDEGLKFMYHSTGNYLAQRKVGDWTYEIDNANQITLRYWLSEFGSIEEPIINPAVVASPEDRTELHEALSKRGDRSESEGSYAPRPTIVRRRLTPKQASPRELNTLAGFV